MFYTPKPRQFHYRPRFYDPEKEEWEQLKMKYIMQQSNVAKADDNAEPEHSTDNKELEYFQRKVRDIDRAERKERQHLTIKDLFRRREKPQFHYVSRFDDDGNLIETPASSTMNSEVKRHIQRRFDTEEDWDRFKPIPAGKIMIYTLLVCVLLFFVFS